MGTCYYFWRDDNQTAFELGKSGELYQLFDAHRPVILMPDYAETFAELWALACGGRGYSPDVLPMLRKVAAEVIAWSEGQPLEFISEHDGRIEDAAMIDWDHSRSDPSRPRRQHVTGTIYRDW